jgi:hypothetical protein
MSLTEKLIELAEDQSYILHAKIRGMVRGTPHTTLDMYLGLDGEPTWEDIVGALKGLLAEHTGYVYRKEEHA